jgi:adenosylcobinamide-GDP ribazoletransferase
MTLPIRPTDLAIALVFFTRLPLPHFDVPDRKLGDAIWAAPIAGLAVALAGWLVCLIAGAFGVPTLPTAALILATTMLVTGCLHEDGFADVADGFGGGKTPARKLEIMHDSRLGTYGGAALAISLLLRWSTLASLVSAGAAFVALIAAHVGSRAIFAKLARETPLAADTGLAATVGEISDSSAMLSLAIGLAALLCLGLFGGFVTAIALTVTIVAFRQLCLRQIGGINGDTLGAAQQIAEITILLAAAAVYS